MSLSRSPLFLMLLGFLLQVGQAPTAGSATFVWGGEVSTGQSYVSVFSPPQVEQLYLLANQTSLLVGRFTEVYYWPIDREYKADWQTLNSRAEGTLEILTSDGELVESVSEQPYILTNDQMTLGNATRLYLGGEALEVYRAYEAERDAFLAATAEYDRQMLEYLKQLAENPDDPTLELPRQPEGFGKVLSPPTPAFPVNVTPGEYVLQFRDASGRVVQESRRLLTAVEPRREGIGYIIFPEDRWTRGEQADDVRDVVYYRAEETTLYFQPYITQEFNEREYRRISEPQDRSASADRWFWAYDKPIDDLVVKVFVDSRPVEELASESFSVQQLPGRRLGYEIVRADSETRAQADFVAYAFAPLAGEEGYTIQLVDNDGSVLAGSKRALVRANSSIPLAGYLLALLPVATAVIVVWYKLHRQSRSVKAIADRGE